MPPGLQLSDPILCVDSLSLHHTTSWVSASAGLLHQRQPRMRMGHVLGIVAPREQRPSQYLLVVRADTGTQTRREGAKLDLPSAARFRATCPPAVPHD